MHQDWAYFPTVQDSMVAANNHVSKATGEMGYFRVYRGTHKLGQIDDSFGNRENDVLASYLLGEGQPLYNPNPAVSYLSITFSFTAQCMSIKQNSQNRLGSTSLHSR